MMWLVFFLLNFDRMKYLVTGILNHNNIYLIGYRYKSDNDDDDNDSRLCCDDAEHHHDVIIILHVIIIIIIIIILLLFNMFHI